MLKIEITRQGTTKVLKDAITTKARTYDTVEAAQAAADSHVALWRCDWKNQGRRLSTYRFVKAA